MAVTDNPFVRPATSPNLLGGRPSGRSMFGKQADSKKPSAPSFTLASSDRSQASKVFLSSAHVNMENRGREGPLGIYDLPSALDPQVEAQKGSAPRYTFSSEQRFRGKVSNVPGPGSYQPLSALGDQPLSPNASPPRPRFGSTTRDQTSKVFVSTRHMREQQGTQGPPPGSYDPPTSMGQQPSSMRRSMPSFTISKTDRLKNKYEEMSRTLPPVGAYETWNAIGRQPLSGFRTLPSYGFGSSTWDKEEKRFLTVGHAAHTLRGTQSPSGFDHQQAGNLTGFGKQPLSSKHSLPSYGFGRASKLVFKATDTPGPGSYD